MISNRMRLRYLPLLLLVGCVGVASAQQGVFITPQGSFPFNVPTGAPQQQSQSTVRRTVTGTVVNSVTGEPIRRALVRVNGPESRSAFTDPDGRFEIPSVPDGNVYLTAQKPGYFDFGASPGPQNGFRNPNVMLGPSTGDVVLKLMPEAKIHGRVLDKTGEPVESVSVQLLAQIIMDGRKQWQIRGQATTDDAGAYALDNLLPGVYAIHTLALAINGASDIPANGETSSEVFPPSYYPDAPDRSSVQPLELKPGQELAIDLNLSPVAGFRVSGVLAGGQPFQLICEDADGQPVSYGTGVNPRTGKFTLSGIPPGTWTLHAYTQPAQDGAAEAEQAIEVSSSDIKGLVLQFQPLPSIAVHVQGQSQTQGSGAMVSLTPMNGNPMRNYAASQESGGSPGSLFFHGISPGTYRVSAQPSNNSECIASVMSGSSDLTREALTVSAGSQPPPIDVTLRNDCASISGMVHSSSEQPGMSSVVLLSDSPLKPPSTVMTGNDGKFFFSNLTPGEYRLFAFTNISDLEYANPEALRDFTGQDITVGPNEKANVQLDLITRGN